MKPRPPADLQIPFDRVTYREGQLLASRDLQDDVVANQRLRSLHTRYLHETWGITLGFTVSGFAGGTSLQVGPGYAIDGSARDILLAETLVLRVPNTQSRADLVLVMSYQEDRAFRALPDTSIVCGSGGLDPRAERPVFAWRTLETLNLGPDVPLARISAQLGALMAAPDLTVRKNATRLLRPHIGFGSVPAEASPGSSIFGEIRVDTTDAGFSTTPQYFARLTPPATTTAGTIIALTGSLAFIDRAAPDSFFYNLPVIGARTLRDVTVTWLGVEPVTGCEPIPNLFLLFNLAGFLNTFIPTIHASIFTREIPR